MASTDSNLLLVTLWAKPEAVLASLPEDARRMVAAATPLYSKDGVNYLLASLAERLLSVDTVIIYGPDLTGSGQALVDALSGKCGEWARIPCEKLGALSIKVIDLRGRYGDLEALVEAIKSSYKPRPPRAATPLPISPPKAWMGYPHPVGWGILYDTSPYYLWVKAVDYLLTYGYRHEGELKASLVAQLGLWGQSLEGGSPRVCSPDELKRALKGEAGGAGGPCVVLQGGERGGWAYLDVLIRGCDVRELRDELPGVASAFFEAAEEMGLRPGLISYLLLDSRLPLDLVEEAKALVEREWRTAYGRDVYDPRGSFVLSGGGLSHYTTDGVLLRITPADRRAILREAAKLLPDHAFYLGEEAAAMKLLGDRYKQEGWR